MALVGTNWEVWKMRNGPPAMQKIAKRVDPETDVPELPEKSWHALEHL
jgi:hypothetical protein